MADKNRFSLLGILGSEILWQGELRPALGRMWPWLLAAGATGYLALMPGVVALSHFGSFESAALVAALSALAFGSAVTAVVVALANDRAVGTA